MDLMIIILTVVVIGLTLGLILKNLDVFGFRTKKLFGFQFVSKYAKLSVIVIVLGFIFALLVLKLLKNL